MEQIMTRLRQKHVRDSTSKNYIAIWRSFNKFVIRLDVKPNSWEDRTALYCTYLINNGSQSQTIKSYVSAIKAVLKDDNYDWDDQKLLLTTLTQACRLKNDKVRCRLPIQKNLLEIILFELNRIDCLLNQVYLQTMYKAIFCLAYYGLMRIGELTESPHTLKARNIHVGTNKNKILIVLYSSKTHGPENYPQKIKISAESFSGVLFCPFAAAREFFEIRGDYADDNENFFVFRDKSAVKPSHVRNILKLCLQSLNLDSTLYNTHSLRIGRTVDLAKKKNLSFSELQKAGRWSSNAVFKYLRT